MRNLPVPRRLVAAGLVLAAVFVVAACSNDDKPTTAEANAELCKSKSELAASVDSIQSIDPETTTVDQVEKLRQDVRDEVAQIDEAAQVVAESELSDLQDAIAQFGDVYDALDPKDTLKQAGTEMNAAAANVKTAFNAVFAKADCA